MILFIGLFILIDFPFVFDIIKCIKLKDKSEFNGVTIMNLLDLDDEVLNDVHKVMSYDSSIPLHYRILGKLNYIDDLHNCMRFIEANRELFNDEYTYLMLDSAVEMCLNIVVDENGKIFSLSDILKNHIYKPAPIELEYIEYLLKNGANPLLPEHFNQYEHIEDMEEDCSHQVGVKFDLSDVRKLFDKYS